MHSILTRLALFSAAALAGLAPIPAFSQAAGDAATANADANTSKIRLAAIPTKRAAERQRSVQSANKVVLYRTAWCGYCKRAAAYMQQQKIQFIERDIEVDERYHAEYKRLGGKGSIPLIQFGDQTMMGFAQEAFDQQYAQFLKGRSSKPAS
jgi:glutaredoxin